jgi:hypothetical protein
VLDLNRILLYADRAGAMAGEPQRRVFTVADGVVAGEGEGPLEASPKPCGVIVAGANSVAVDAVCARLMGFDARRIPIIARAAELTRHRLIGFRLDEIEVRSADPEWHQLDVLVPGPSFGFEPAAGWRGVIELRDGRDEVAAGAAR